MAGWSCRTSWREALASWILRTLLLLILVPSAAYSQSSDMTFHVDESAENRFLEITMNGGQQDIYASGNITKGTTERFLKFVRDHNITAARVNFDSPGGSLIEGIQFGEAIRSLHFDTAVNSLAERDDPMLESSSICASACAYAFAGGEYRYLDQYSGKLGIHQFYSGEGSELTGQDAQIVSGLIVEFLSEMGVDARAFVLSTVADKTGMVWLTPELAAQLNFANNGAKPTTAELKMVDMRPYLKLEQERRLVTARVLLTCHTEAVHLLFGIVTDAESANSNSNAKRSYLEMDHDEFGAVPGAVGFEVADATIWLTRPISAAAEARLQRTDVLGGWIDGFGALRWGATIDLSSVRQPMQNFIQQCR